MDPNSEEIDQDLSHIHWSWPEAVAANPSRSLATPDLAMDYFAYSPFWDSKSNNNVLRTQRRIENPTYGHAEEKVELNAFRSGFEYIIAHASPPDMFIIHRRDVHTDGSRDNVSGIWWILREKIYPTPTLYEVVSARLQNASYLISNTFSALSSRHPQSNPRTNNLWRSLTPTSDPIESNRNSNQNQRPEIDVEGDIEMGDTNDKPTTTTTTISKEKENTKTTSNQNPSLPDWHLFHALQTTRSSLSDLERLSRSKPNAKLAEDSSTGVKINPKSGLGLISGSSVRGGSVAPGASPLVLGRLGLGVGTPGTVSTPMSGVRP